MLSDRLHIYQVTALVIVQARHLGCHVCAPKTAFLDLCPPLEDQALLGELYWSGLRRFPLGNLLLKNRRGLNSSEHRFTVDIRTSISYLYYASFNYVGEIAAAIRCYKQAKDPRRPHTRSGQSDLQKLTIPVVLMDIHVLCSLQVKVWLMMCSRSALGAWKETGLSS